MTPAEINYIREEVDEWMGNVQVKKAYGMELPSITESFFADATFRLLDEIDRLNAQLDHAAGIR